MSKKALEDRLGEPVTSFSYPFGLHNGTVRSLVAAAGYQFACGVYTGPARFGADPYDIRRLAIGSEVGDFGFLNRMRLPYAHVESAWNRFRQLGRSLLTPSEDPAIPSP
jgi:peptidoglycan/xylan/chitin deacetylase (PgdA/CDA1 family)